MNYSLNIGEWNSVFAVPSGVVDKYIKLASGNSLKLLLFLLRHGGESFSADKLSAELNFSEAGELEDAAVFWAQRGIIRLLSENEGQYAAAPEITENLGEGTAKSEIQEMPQIAAIPTKKDSKIAPASVSSREIASRILEDKNIKTLFDEAEKLYAHPLRQRENQTIISLVDHYGLPVGVSLMLLQYCKKIDRLTPSYITTVAADWTDNDIITIEKAEERIRSLEKMNGIEERLRAALDMKTAFTPAQKKYFRIWTEEWGFSEEMILLAINRTIEQIGNPKLNYTNRIIENWKADGITTTEQAENPALAQKSGNTNTSFDKNDVMANILKKYKG